jgi:hypothetical protein
MNDIGSFEFKGRSIGTINDSIDNKNDYVNEQDGVELYLFYEENEDKTFTCNLLSRNPNIDTFGIVNEFNVSKTIFSEPDQHDICNFMVYDIHDLIG